MGAGPERRAEHSEIRIVLRKGARRTDADRGILSGRPSAPARSVTRANDLGNRGHGLAAWKAS